MGEIAETAVYSQWFHSDTLLYYSRWKNGEVDIVKMSNEQRVEWAIEVKWTDRFYRKPKELKSLFKFCHSNNLDRATVTTKSKTGNITMENIHLDFIPTSLYCYTVGHNFIKDKQYIGK